MRKTAGFKCPKCKKDDGNVFCESKDVQHILALRHSTCGHAWAVECRHPAVPWGFMEPDGRVL